MLREFLRQHEKTTVLLMVAVAAVATSAVLFGVQTLEQTASFDPRSSAAEGQGGARPRLCDKCDLGGGVEHCKSRFDAMYAEYQVAKPKWKEATLRNKAFSEMDKDDSETAEFDEENCGYCDLFPERGPGSWRFGDRHVNQQDIDLYSRMCFVATPTLNPTATPELTMTPTSGPVNCSACDMTVLRTCIFSPQKPECVGRDPNGDGKLDAGDLAWCPLNCPSQQVTQTLQIQAGWNLVSLYVEPSNSQVETILTPLINQHGSNISVFAYENSMWKFYKPNLPVRTLYEIHAGRGLWIQSQISATISITGLPPASNVPLLSENVFNLVGITSATPQPVSSIINTTQYPNLRIWQLSSATDPASFNELVSPGRAYVTEPTLEPGVGYWVHLNPPDSNATAPGIPAD